MWRSSSHTDPKTAEQEQKIVLHTPTAIKQMIELCSFEEMKTKQNQIWTHTHTQTEKQKKMNNKFLEFIMYVSVDHNLFFYCCSLPYMRLCCCCCCFFRFCFVRFSLRPREYCFSFFSLCLYPAAATFLW